MSKIFILFLGCLFLFSGCDHRPPSPNQVFIGTIQDFRIGASGWYEVTIISGKKISFYTTHDLAVGDSIFEDTKSGWRFWHRPIKLSENRD